MRPMSSQAMNEIESSPKRRGGGGGGGGAAAAVGVLFFLSFLSHSLWRFMAVEHWSLSCQVTTSQEESQEAEQEETQEQVLQVWEETTASGGSFF